MKKRGEIKTSIITVIILTLFILILKAEDVIPQSSPKNDLTINQTILYIDSRLLEEFNKNSEVAIIVKVRDTSKISISAKDTKEQQVIKDQKRKEFLENRTGLVLSTLPETEFRLKKKLQAGNGFSGYIMLNGFNTLINNSNIKSIYLNKPLHVALDESGPLINADYVETAGYTGKYQTVCVLDTGIDYDISDLGGCFGSGCKVRSGWDYYNNDNDPDDDNGHGTHVAGIIASEDATYRGIAPDADLVALKVCNASGDCFPDDIVDGLFYCYQNRNIYNISVISISIGDHGEYSENCSNPNWAQDEINDLYNIEIPVFVASDNNYYRNGISYPACSPNVTSVGATDKNDNIASYTNRDNSPLAPDLLAPGGVWGSPYDTPPSSEIISLYSQDVATDPDLCFLWDGPWINGICNDHMAKRPLP